MRISCDSCGAPIPAGDVNIERLVAKCRRCDSVFAFGSRLGHAPAPRVRPPLPRGIRIESGEPPLPREGGYRSAPSAERGPLVISRRWFRMHHVFMLFFTIFWDGFLVVWYSTGIASGAPLEMLLFPLLHVAVGIGITYGVLMGLINRTTIRVEAGTLTVRHGPLPWFGNLTIDATRLRQLYLRRQNHRTKNGGSYSTWRVLAETDTLEALPIVGKLHDRDQAEYIEWAIEGHLGIEDDARSEQES